MEAERVGRLELAVVKMEKNKDLQTAGRLAVERLVVGLVQSARLMQCSGKSSGGWVPRVLAVQ